MPAADARRAALHAAGAQRSRTLEYLLSAPTSLSAPILQIAAYLENHREGSWYAAPALAASADEAVYRGIKRALEDNGSASGCYRSVGADAEEEEVPKYTSLSGFDGDAWAFPDDKPPQPRRMGALGPADWNFFSD